MHTKTELELIFPMSIDVASMSYIGQSYGHKNFIYIDVIKAVCHMSEPTQTYKNVKNRITELG